MEISKNNGNSSTRFRAVVIGVSAGGMKALPQVLRPLPGNFPVPVMIVQHSHPSGDGGFLVRYLDERCNLLVKEVEESEPIVKGKAYLAPADYHIVVEEGEIFTLSSADKVNYSRPSIDVLFESAAGVYHSGLIGVILTGASSDGSRGLERIKNEGGLAIVQDPDTAEARVMPGSAIRSCEVDYVLSLSSIPETLVELLARQLSSVGQEI